MSILEFYLKSCLLLGCWISVLAGTGLSVWSSCTVGERDEIRYVMYDKLFLYFRGIFIISIFLCSWNEKKNPKTQPCKKSSGRGKISVISKVLFEQNVISLQPDLWKVLENWNIWFWKHRSGLLLEHPITTFECCSLPEVLFSFKFPLEYNFCWKYVASNTWSYNNVIFQWKNCWL